jgi:uncharacterized membrane protein
MENKELKVIDLVIASYDSEEGAKAKRDELKDLKQIEKVGMRSFVITKYEDERVNIDGSVVKFVGASMGAIVGGIAGLLLGGPIGGALIGGVIGGAGLSKSKYNLKENKDMEEILEVSEHMAPGSSALLVAVDPNSDDVAGLMEFLELDAKKVIRQTVSDPKHSQEAA